MPIPTEILNAAAEYLLEAELCCTHSKRVLGLAAMSTSLACAMAIGEMLLGESEGRRSDQQIIGAFVTKMKRRDWLVPLPTCETDVEIAYMLTAIRNSLAHALSLPTNVVLLPGLDDPTLESARLSQNVILPAAFVESVRVTIREIEAEPEARSATHVIGDKPRGPVTVTMGASSAGTLPR